MRHNGKDQVGRKNDELRPVDIRRNAGSAIGVIDQLLDSVGAICSRLRPPMLDELGLIDALDWYIHSIKQHAELEIHYSYPKAELEVRDDIATCLFRTCQELLTNVLRHSRATNADITIEIEEDALTLVVEDDGVGISLDSKNNSSLGLAGITEQVSGFGGDFMIEKINPGGTRAVVRMPLVRGQSIT